jgi:hypothetical protein
MHRIVLLAVSVIALVGCSKLLGLNDPTLVDVDGSLPTSQAPNIVFVSSVAQNANYGGIEGADSACQALAQAAGVAGTYRAWLSTTTVNAVDRLTSASGWVRIDGKPVANTAADLVAGRMFHPIRLTESGSDAFDTEVYTGTASDGTLQSGASTCNDYTSADDELIVTGFSTGTSSLFTSFNRVTCAEAARLYCFGVDRQASVTIALPGAIRYAFLSSDSWRPDGNLASADLLCASEASAAGLPGTYKALLATETASAASRFDTTLAPWARVDGVLLAATAEELFSSPYWDTSLTVLADGTYATSGALLVGGGGTNLSAAGTSALTCNNWSGTGTLGGGLNGIARVTGLFALEGDFECSSGVRLACLQE